MEEVKEEIKKPLRYDYERCELRLTMKGETIHKEEIRPETLNKTVFNSMDIVYAMDECTEIIEADLKDKALQYLEYCSPQFVSTYDDIHPWLMKHPKYIDGPTYFVTDNDKSVYYVSDGDVRPYVDKDYPVENFKSDEPYDDEAILKVALYYRGREKIARIIDLSQYPPFIRNTIDITNSKHRLETYSPCEFGMCEIFNERESLVPKIKKILLDVISYDNNEEYTTKFAYEGGSFDLSAYKTYMKTIYAMEGQYKRKTNNYFNSFTRT